MREYYEPVVFQWIVVIEFEAPENRGKWVVQQVYTGKCAAELHCEA